MFFFNIDTKGRIELKKTIIVISYIHTKQNNWENEKKMLKNKQYLKKIQCYWFIRLQNKNEYIYCVIRFFVIDEKNV